MSRSVTEPFFRGPNLHAPGPGLLLSRGAIGSARGENLAFLANQLTSAVGIPGATSVWTGEALFIGAPERSTAHAIREVLLDADRRLAKDTELPTADALIEPIVDAWLGLREVALMAEACARRGVPWCFPWETPTLVMGEGARSRVYHPFALASSHALGAVADDKLAIARLLESAGLPTGQPYPVGSASDAVARFRAVGGPVVIKPSRAWAQVGVWLDLRTESDVRRAFQRATVQAGPLGGGILVERYRPGHSIRATLVNGRLVAAYEAWAPRVVGDGVRRIDDLARKVHGLDDKEAWHARVRGVLEATLSSQGWKATDVPPKGRRIEIGLPIHGRKKDVTGQIHPTMRAALERVARVIPGLVLGVDVLLPRASAPFDPRNCAIVDVNAAPGFIDHTTVGAGEPIDVAGAIVDALFPTPLDARVVVVGSADGRLLERAAAEADVPCAGYTRGRAWSGRPRDVLGEGPAALPLIRMARGAETILVAIDDALANTGGLPLGRIDLWAGKSPIPNWLRPVARGAKACAGADDLAARLKRRRKPSPPATI